MVSSQLTSLSPQGVLQYHLSWSYLHNQSKNSLSSPNLSRPFLTRAGGMRDWWMRLWNIRLSWRATLYEVSWFPLAVTSGQVSTWQNIHIHTWVQRTEDMAVVRYIHPARLHSLEGGLKTSPLLPSFLHSLWQRLKGLIQKIRLKSRQVSADRQWIFFWSRCLHWVSSGGHFWCTKKFGGWIVGFVTLQNLTNSPANPYHFTKIF